MRRRALTIAVLACAVLTATAAAGEAAQPRVIEQVTPADAGGYDIVNPFPTPSGDHVFWSTSGDPYPVEPDGGNTGQVGLDVLASARGSTGWRHAWLTPYPGRSLLPGAAAIAGSPDGRRVLFQSSDPMAAGVEVVVPPRLFIGTEDGVQMVSIDHAGRPAPRGFPGMDDVAASADLSVVAFTWSSSLTPADQDAHDDVYVWREGEGVSLVSARQDGVDPGVGSSRLARRPTRPGLRAQHGNAVSADGRRIFFESADQLVPEDENLDEDVYVLDDGVLRAITTEGGAFEGATPDGEYVFVRAGSQATSRLARVEVATGAAVEVAPATAGINRNILRDFSDDGSRAAYATGNIIAQTGLILWADGVTTQVSDNAPVATGIAATDHLLRFSSDGEVMVFVTASSLLPEDTDDRRDVYRYADGTLSLISRGGNGPFDAWIGLPNVSQFSRPDWRGMSADGDRIFFMTAERLVPEDRNDAVDVYEHVDGEIVLISPGDEDLDAEFWGNGDDGRDVFFATGQSIDGAYGGNPIVYDARIGGGFPRTPRPPECSGSGCQGPFRVPGSPFPRPLSAAFAGEGNVVMPTGPTVRLAVKRLGKRQRRAFARRGRTSLVVRASAPGRLTAIARARVGGRNRIVGVARGTVRRAGAVRLQMRLSRAARARLRRQGTLAVSIRVSHSRARTVRTLGVKLALPAKQRGRLSRQGVR